MAGVGDVTEYQTLPSSGLPAEMKSSTVRHAAAAFASSWSTVDSTVVPLVDQGKPSGTAPASVSLAGASPSCQDGRGRLGADDDDAVVAGPHVEGPLPGGGEPVDDHAAARLRDPGGQRTVREASTDQAAGAGVGPSGPSAWRPAGPSDRRRWRRPRRTTGVVARPTSRRQPGRHGQGDDERCHERRPQPIPPSPDPSGRGEVRHPPFGVHDEGPPGEPGGPSVQAAVWIRRSGSR